MTGKVWIFIGLGSIPSGYVVAKFDKNIGLLGLMFIN